MFAEHKNAFLRIHSIRNTYILCLKKCIHYKKTLSKVSENRWLQKKHCFDECLFIYRKYICLCVVGNTEKVIVHIRSKFYNTDLDYEISVFFTE